MSSMEPPPFQEAARCDVCKCSFNTFRRRHHCRCCGRTLCSEHSSNQMVLPQFGIHTPVRVCANCYNKSSVSVKGVTQTSAGVNQVSDAVARLDIHADIDSRAENIPCHQPFPSIMECRCGMPLCICEPTVHPGDAIPQQGISANVQPVQKPNKIEIPRNRGITNNKSLHISTTGQEMDSNSENLKMDYEANGEGLREAIKNDDIAAVKKLLKEGVNANYRDKQRMSLLHLAAVFNRTDIAFILMDCGASTDYQNAQGETPLDCAPATLQYKMRKRMEERNQRTACQTDHT